MNNPEDHFVLKTVVEKIHNLTDKAWDDFIPLWTEFLVKRKEVITRVGDIEKHLYVVLEGVQRIYYLDDQDREATVVLTYAPSFGGVLDSFLLQKPSRYWYESLTPSRFLRAHSESIITISKKHESIAQMIQKGVANSFSGILERMVELQCFSSEEKFKQLMQRSPHILKLIPHKYIANYLGIDPTNFSKLINSVRI